MVAPYSKIYVEIWVGFCLKTRKRFLLEVSFQSQQKEHRFFYKTVQGIFKIALRLRDPYVFIGQLVEIKNGFNTLTLEQIFWKTKTFFKKLENHFLVESSKIENALFPYESVISEANVKTNRMVNKKWSYHKERSFDSNYFIFWKIFFQFKKLL